MAMDRLFCGEYRITRETSGISTNVKKTVHLIDDGP